MKKISEFAFLFGLFFTGVFFGGARPSSYILAFFVFLTVFALSIFSGDIKENLKKTFSFKPFLFLIFFAIYILIQNANIFAKFTPVYGESLMTYMPFYLLLPSGVNALYDNSLCTESLLIFIGTFACAIASANLLFKDEKFILKSAATISLGAFACAAIGLCVHFFAKDNRLMLGIFETSASPFGTFFYRNQAAAYMIIGLGLTGALWGNIFFSFKILPSEKTKPFFVFGFAFLVLISALFFSNSIGGVIVGFITLLALISIALIKLIFRGEKTKFFLFASLIFLGLSGAGVTIYMNPALLSQKMRSRMDALKTSPTLEKGINELGSGRHEIKLVSLNMIKNGGSPEGRGSASQRASKIFFGGGSNSYGDISKVFMPKEHNVSKKLKLKDGEERTYQKRLIYAHSDPLQFLFEYGIFWAAILLTFFVRFIYKLYKAKFWKNYFLSAAFATIFIIIVYSFNDIILYNNFITLNMLIVFMICSSYAKLLKEKETLK